MKLLVLSCVVIGVLAELPRYRPARFRFQRQELAPTTTESPTEATTEQSGPYPPSGWKPAGEPFTLPNEDKQPANQYGPPDAPYPPSGWKPQGQAFELPKEPPATSYGVPDNTYGVPDSTYGAPVTTDAPTTESPDAENLTSALEVIRKIGPYLVLLPESQLKKILELQKDTKGVQDTKMNPKMSARLQIGNNAFRV